MKKILTTSLSTFLACLLFGQQAPNYWKQVQYDEVFLPEKAETAIFPNEYLIYFLDIDEMVNYLRDAPMEGTAEAKAGGLKVLLPMPDGSFESFQAWESPIMHPDLGEKYPMIRSYAGRGIDNPASTVRFGYSPAGFYAIVPNENGGAITEQYATYQDKYYITYSHSNFLVENLNVPLIQYIKDKESGTTENPIVVEDDIEVRGGGEGALTERRDYLFVLACTGEYGQTHGGTIPTVLGTLVQALGAMNGLLERDIDVRFTMHPSNDQVVYVNAGSDPYINANMGGALLGQNENLLNQVIGQANFDVGHVYTGPCTDVGGVVSGTVCATGKARGVTCNFGTNVIATTLSIAAHEIMHQFSGGHTFNHCPGQSGQFSSASAWEPGSGSTILSYQGSCGSSNNVPGPATLQYHAGNVEQVWNYTHSQGGAVCVDITTTSNHSPVVTENYKDGFFIPISTPFELEVNATDADSDPLTYSWEQMNRTPSAPVGAPIGDAPTFRVYDHNPSPIRYFPRLQTILNNGSDVFEILPTFDKNLKFRCIVRDNNVAQGAGGVTWTDVNFNATETAGPFRVTNPNSSAVVWTAGEQVEVTWDVADTDKGLVKCKSVNILLSNNGGNTFEHLVLSGTPNDGSEVITVPGLIGTNIRLKIKAVDNIFFDLSNANFEIKPPVEPFYSLQIAPEHQRSCVPEMTFVDINMDAFAGYNQPVELDIVDGLPAGTSYDFSNNPVMPGGSTTLALDMEDVVDIGLFEVTLRAISNNDTTFRTLFLEVIYNDFSAIVLQGPIDGGSDFGLQPTFTWTPLPQADQYDFQLSTSPDFEAGSIIEDLPDLLGTSITLDFALDENTIYYWRIRPSNICGKGDFSLKNSFQTFNTECVLRSSPNVPVNIPPTGLPIVKSQVTVLESGIISDVNIRDLKGTHDAIPDIEVSVISPAGTQVLLFGDTCGNVTTFNLGFNDEAPFNLQCPPNTGQTYRPKEPLSKFDGENTLGNWELQVEVINTIGNGGTLQSWSIEFCASVNPEHPFMINNDTIYVKPNDTRIVHYTEFSGADPDDPTASLVITILDETKHGFMSKSGVPLGPGDTFKFTDVNGSAIAYTNTNPDAVYDFFTFTVTDGHGGLLGTPRFNIVIDEDAVTAVDDLERENKMTLFPNPAMDKLGVRFSLPILTDATLLISDVQGRVLGQQNVQQNADLLQIDLNGLSDGIYFMTVKSGEGVMTERFVVQH